MGLFDRFKKNLDKKDKDSIKTVVKSQNNNDSTDEIIFDFDENIESTNSGDSNLNKNSETIRNFTYLDELIHSGKTDVILNCDIILDDDEWLDYTNGINLDVDNLIIDGNGFKISSNNETRIFNVEGNNIVLKNLSIESGNSYDGGAIFNNGSLIIKNSNFNNNSARNGSTIFNNNGSNLKCIKCNFSKNHSTSMGGVIYNGFNAHSEFVKCNFDENFSNQKDGHFKNIQMTHEHSYSGGVIFNLGKVDITESYFTNNSAVQGGVIYNQHLIKIFDSNFFNNKSFEGSVIYNLGEIELKNSNLENNVAEGVGTINNTESVESRISSNLHITNCNFRNNFAHLGSGINNFSKVVVDDSKFIGNSVEERGIIQNQNAASIFILKSDFCKNAIGKYGGIIDNFGTLVLDETSFIENGSKVNANDIFNEGSTKINNSHFIESNNNNFFNKGKLCIYNSDFEDNNSDYNIWNDDDASLSLTDGRFISNYSRKGIIYNLGECDISDLIFEDNIENDCNLVCNRSNMKLQNLKIKNEFNIKPVLNKGYLEVRKFKKNEIQLLIDNKGKLEDFSFNSDELNSFNFSYLNDIIHKNKHSIYLLEDISLDNYESDFFIGGIELDVDNLIIEGNGKSIDCKNKSRIFNVTGKNIVIKDVIFINGNLSNDFDSHSNGGGVLKIVKGASLELKNCKFFNNHSDDDGGVILNNGLLRSEGCLFKNNHSNNFGGAIYVRGIFNSENDIFEENSSKLAPCIYNYGNLDLKNVTLLNNTLDFKKLLDADFKEYVDSYPNEEIFNNGNLYSDDVSSSLIYNISRINQRKSNAHFSFKDLNKLINDFNDIKLDNDVVFDYKLDLEHIKGIDVDKKDLVIDGLNHIIDARNSACFFNILANNIIFKNIIFKNGFSNNKEIFNVQGEIKFENCIFEKNKTLNDFPVIKNDSHISLVDCILSNNSSDESPIIANFSKLNVLNSKCINNFSKENSIFHNSDELFVDNSEFLYNSSFNQASIFNNNSQLNLNESIFFNNESKRDGGVIYNYRKLISAGCTFLNNVATSGGAIYNSGFLELDDCQFIDNSSHESGGCIYNFEGCEINECKFLYNHAKIGSVIYNRGNVNMFDSNLLFNHDSMYGTIIIQRDATIKHENCKFFSNYPENILNLNNLKLD